MRFSRLIPALLLAACVSGLARAGENDAPAPLGMFSSLAGAEDELAALALERRDELAAARMRYFSAFKKHLAAPPPDGFPAEAYWLRALALLRKLQRLEVEYPGTDRLRAFLETLPETFPGAGGERFATAVRLARLELLTREGKPDVALRETGRLGFVSVWQAIGPFPEEGSAELEAVLAVSPKRLFGGEYYGTFGKTGWRTANCPAPDGCLPLEDLFRPGDAVYLAFSVSCDRETPARLYFGSAQAYRVWLNGKPLLSYPPEGFPPAPARHARPDQETAACTLAAGGNLIVIRAARAGAWEFYARAEPAASGAGLKLSRQAADFPASYSATAPAPPAANPNPDQVFYQLLPANRADAHLAYYLGFLAGETRGPGGSGDVALLETAARLNPRQPAYLLALAEAAARYGGVLPDSDVNYVHDALLAAAESGADEVAARAQLAAHLRAQLGNWLQAGAHLEAALAANPAGGGARLLAAKRDEEEGLAAAAETELRELLRRNPRCVAGLLQLGELRERRGDAAEAAGMYARAAELSPENRAAALRLDRQLDELGKLLELQKSVAAQLRLRPLDWRARLILARVLQRAGKPEAAAAELEQTLAAFPDNIEAMKLLAKCLRAAGRLPEAQTAWRRAVTLDPADRGLREDPAFAPPAATTETGDAGAALLAATVPAELAQRHACYLFYKKSWQLRDGGARLLRVHFAARILDEEGARRFQEFSHGCRPDCETTRVLRARTLRPDVGALTSRRQISESGLRVSHVPLCPSDTVEVEFEVERYRADYFGDYFGDRCVLTQDFPVVAAEYAVSCAAGRELYSHSRNGAPEPTKTGSETETRLTWTLANLPAAAREPRMPPDWQVFPCAEVSTFKDWGELGRWYWRLIEPQLATATALSAQARALTEGLGSEREKAAALCGWVSESVRYIPWEFGVYGYKPYGAATVFARRFGDCKDKAALLGVMARETGLAAWPALLRSTTGAGRGREDFSLPLLLHFNHCISALNADGARVFADATAKFRAFGGLPPADSGATAAVITPDGALLETLPEEKPEANLWQDEVGVLLNADGSASITQTVRGRGLAAAYLRSYFGRKDEADYQMLRLSNINYGRASGAAATLEDPGDESRPVALTARAYVKDYAAGNESARAFRLPPVLLRETGGTGGLLPERLRDYADRSERHYDLLLPVSLRVERKLVFTWPQGSRLAGRPKTVDLESEYWALKTSATEEDGALTVSFLLELRRRIIPAAAYPEFRKFCAAADRALQTRLVLEKK